MKIVVIGGAELLGSQAVENLRARGHEAVPVSPSSGVNTVTGDGLEATLAGAEIVVDAANSPSIEEAEALAEARRQGLDQAPAEVIIESFLSSRRNLLKAEADAG
ncbi:MAG: hypothetical protein ACREQM_12480, partial [Candidatus Dormibacteraceae bacterium]